MFSSIAFGLRRDFGAAASTFLINPNQSTVHGTTTFASCVDVPGGIDCAYLMVPQTLMAAAIDDAARAGARSAVVLSGGYAETGEAGREAQDELLAQCRRYGMVLLGPNHLGFANIADQTVVCTLPGITPRVGHVALVSQSGALAGTFALYAARNGIHFSFVATTGNEAMVTAEQIVDYALDLEATRSVAVFAETIRHPEVFVAAARKAARMGKAIVVLKAGASELAARTAAAHTGALVGDDAVVDAVFRQEGVIRVEDMETLLVTAHLAAYTGRWPRPGAAVTSMSGGACDVIADRAEQYGLPLPALAAETEQALSGVISDLGGAQNPLDVTGAAMIDPTLMGRVAAVLADDPSVGFMLITGGENTLAQIGSSMAGKAVKAAVAPVVAQELSPSTAEVLDEIGMAYLPSLRDAVLAMANISAWSARIGELEVAEVSDATIAETTTVEGAGRPWSEVQVRSLLEHAGIPVVPGELVTSPDDAVRVAAGFGGAVAMKIVSSGIAHKTDIGGVVLNVHGEDSVRSAFRSVIAGVDDLDPVPEVDGVLVSPMRVGGIELLVGVTRDAAWGPVLAIAVGGVLVEILKDSSLLRLPTTPSDIRAALGRLRGAALLDGLRGQEPADIDRVVDVIARIGELAGSLGPRLETLEVNPLLVRGSEVEALDALLSWTSS
jgi:acetate---CoA ligase (ADP-forming)